MKRLYVYWIGCLSLLSISSCQDFLEKYPTNAIPEEEAYETYADFERHCLGVYSSLKATSGFTVASRIYGDIQCDLAYSVQGFTNDLGSLYNWSFNGSTGEVNTIFSAMWTTIGRVNRIMDHLPQMFENVSQEDSAKMVRLSGEIYFIRALCYSEMTKYYCDAYDPSKAEEQLGLPLCESTLVKNVPRSSLKDTYQFIYDDLDRAEDRIKTHITAEDVAEGYNCFLSLEAVQALRARMALYQKDYPLAFAQARKAFSACSAGGMAIPDATWSQGSTTAMMLLQQEFVYDANLEVIFMIGMNPDDVRGSMGSIFLGIRGTLTDYYPNFVPSKYLLDLYDPRDMRKQVFFSMEKTAFNHGLTWEILRKDTHNPNLDMSPSSPAFQSQPKLFRLSELLLIIVEACAMPGMDLETGIATLNDFRACRIPKYDGPKTYSREQLLKEVQEERARELCFEGFRLADLKRWNQGFRRIPQPYTNAPSNAMVISPGDPKFTWPIPKHELDINPNMKPNPSN